MSLAQAHLIFMALSYHVHVLFTAVECHKQNMTFRQTKHDECHFFRQIVEQKPVFMQQFAQKRAFCVDFLSACQCDVELLLNLQQLQFKVLVCRHGLGDQAVGALHRLMIPRKEDRKSVV